MSVLSDKFSSFSPREIIGTIVPGGAVIAAGVFVFRMMPDAGSLPPSGIALENPLGGVALAVAAYLVGVLIRPLGPAAQNWLIQVGSLEHQVPPQSEGPTRLEAAMRRVKSRLRKGALHLAGGRDVSTLVDTFRQGWQTTVASDGIVSKESFHLAAHHYKRLFTVDPIGEEALWLCEMYLRQREPGVMKEIEHEAARSDLLGNLTVPMLAWLVALLVGIVVSIRPPWPLGLIVGQTTAFIALFFAFPLVSREIGIQRIEASRSYVRTLLLSFVLSCQLTPYDRPQDQEPAGALGTEEHLATFTG